MQGNERSNFIIKKENIDSQNESILEYSPGVKSALNIQTPNNLILNNPNQNGHSCHCHISESIAFNNSNINQQSNQSHISESMTFNNSNHNQQPCQCLISESMTFNRSNCNQQCHISESTAMNNRNQQASNLLNASNQLTLFASNSLSIANQLALQAATVYIINQLALTSLNHILPQDTYAYLNNLNSLTGLGSALIVFRFIQSNEVAFREAIQQIILFTNSQFNRQTSDTVVSPTPSCSKLNNDQGTISNNSTLIHQHTSKEAIPEVRQQYQQRKTQSQSSIVDKMDESEDNEHLEQFMNKFNVKNNQTDYQRISSIKEEKSNSNLQSNKENVQVTFNKIENQPSSSFSQYLSGEEESNKKSQIILNSSSILFHKNLSIDKISDVKLDLSSCIPVSTMCTTQNKEELNNNIRDASSELEENLPTTNLSQLSNIETDNQAALPYILMNNETDLSIKEIKSENSLNNQYFEDIKISHTEGEKKRKIPLSLESEGTDSNSLTIFKLEKRLKTEVEEQNDRMCDNLKAQRCRISLNDNKFCSSAEEISRKRILPQELIVLSGKSLPEVKRLKTEKLSCLYNHDNLKSQVSEVSLNEKISPAAPSIKHKRKNFMPDESEKLGKRMKSDVTDKNCNKINLDMSESQRNEIPIDNIFSSSSLQEKAKENSIKMEVINKAMMLPSEKHLMTRRQDCNLNNSDADMFISFSTN